MDKNNPWINILQTQNICQGLKSVVVHHCSTTIIYPFVTYSKQQQKHFISVADPVGSGLFGSPGSGSFIRTKTPVLLMFSLYKIV